MPTSLRSRLTLSYATLTALSLTIVFCALLALGMQRYIRWTQLSIDDVITTTRTILTDNWSQSDAQLTQLIMQQQRPAGVRIIVRAVRPAGLPSPPPGGRTGFPGRFRPAGVPPERSLSSLFGLRMGIIWLHHGDVFIGPEIPIDGLLGIGLGALGIALALTVVISWTVGRWITQQAILPLTTVTKELRRFAAGDFVPSVLETRDQSELGELIEAFNGAAAKSSRRSRNASAPSSTCGCSWARRVTRCARRSRSSAVPRGARAQRAGRRVDLRRRRYRRCGGETRRLRELVERVMSLARIEKEGPRPPRARRRDGVAREAIARVSTARPAEVRLTPTTPTCRARRAADAP